MKRIKLERFLNKVTKTRKCWLWKGYTNKQGYGTFRFKGKIQRAHRVAYQLAVGPIPEGLFVCHKCDTPGCVRPSHLWAGTNQENIIDSCRKGRTLGHVNDWLRKNKDYLPQGNNHKNSKLTAEQVVEIRNSGRTMRESATKYKVCDHTIWSLINRITWGHVK